MVSKARRRLVLQKSPFDFFIVILLPQGSFELCCNKTVTICDNLSVDVKCKGNKLILM